MLIPMLNNAFAVLEEKLLSSNNEVNKICVLTNGKLLDWMSSR